MSKIAASLGLGALLLSAAPASACPTERAPFAEATPVRFAAWTIPVAIDDDDDVLAADTIASADDDAATQAAYLAEQQSTAQAMRLWMQSLASGLIALLTIALAAVGLARLGNARRPLATTVLARRPVPAAVVLSLLVPGGAAAGADARRARDPAVAGAADGVGLRGVGAVDAPGDGVAWPRACAGR